MKFQTLIMTTLAGIALTACTSAPTIPQLELGVLQEVQNLEAYPETTNNSAKLTKFSDKCVIEFRGELENSRVIEQWSFKGLTLIDAGSATFMRDNTSTAQKFDLYDATTQKNFLALRNHFAKEAIEQCN